MGEAFWRAARRRLRHVGGVLQVQSEDALDFAAFFALGVAVYGSFIYTNRQS